MRAHHGIALHRRRGRVPAPTIGGHGAVSIVLRIEVVLRIGQVRWILLVEFGFVIAVRGLHVASREAGLAEAAKKMRWRGLEVDGGNNVCVRRGKRCNLAK